MDCQVDTEESCFFLSHGKIFWQLTNKFDDSLLYEGIIMLSAFINTVFFFLMWRIKELQAHPMILFMLITACDAYVLYCFTMSTLTCDWKLQKLLMWTLF